MGHDGAGHDEPRSIVLRVLRVRRPDVRPLRLGHQRRGELRRHRRERWRDERSRSRRRPRVLAVAARVHAAGVDLEHVGRGGVDVRRRTGRTGAGRTVGTRPGSPQTIRARPSSATSASLCHRSPRASSKRPNPTRATSATTTAAPSPSPRAPRTRKRRCSGSSSSASPTSSRSGRRRPHGSLRTRPTSHRWSSRRDEATGGYFTPAARRGRPVQGARRRTRSTPRW